MENLATDNSSTAVLDNPSGEPTGSLPETGANGGQAGANGSAGATPTTDLFKGVDPNKLPPEIKAHYDSMLRDYREKTTKLSETTKAEIAKATESYKSKAEQYDQIATQEEFVRRWNEYVAEQQGRTVQENGDPKLTQMEKQLQEMSQKFQVAELTEVTNAFAEAMDEKGAKLHPEFDSLNSISIGQVKNGEAAEDFSLLRACVELSGGKTPAEKLANGYKAAKATYDAIYEQGKKAGMGRLQAKVLNGSIPPTSSMGDTLTLTDKKPKNAREAMDMARKNQVVSRD